MKQQELEQRVTTAVEHATPDKLETVLSECETRRMRQPTWLRSGKRKLRLAAAFAQRPLQS